MRQYSLILFLVPLFSYGQINQQVSDTSKLKTQFVDYLLKSKLTWTKIDKPKSFETTIFKKAGLMIPKTVKRYYKYENNDSTNYLSTGIYPHQDHLIKGEDDNLYEYYDVSFSGSNDQFTLNYSYSVGLGYSCQGTYFIESGISLQTEYGYGTSSGTITVTQNGKQVFSRKINREKR